MAAAAQTAAAQVVTSHINKFSWCDEEAKVKIYIDTDQFRGEVTKDQVQVRFEEYEVDVKVTDEEGNVHVRNFYK